MMTLTKIHNRMIDASVIKASDYGQGSFGLQAAINAASGKIVDLGNQEFLLDATVNLISNVTIRNGSLTQVSDNISCLYGDGLSNIVIENITFTGKTVSGAPSPTTVGRLQANQAIKLIGSCANTTIRNCRISGFENHGIYVFGSSRMLIEQNVISNIGERNTSVDTPIDAAAFSAYSGGLSCLYIDGNSTDTNEKIVIRENTLSGCLNTILSLVFAKDVAFVYENEMFDGDSNAFQWGTGCEAVKCCDNYVHDLTGLYDPTVEGYALSIHQEGHHSEIVGNYIQNIKRGAINTKGSDYVVVSENYIRNGNDNANFGAIVSYGSYNRIEENTLYNCKFNGIHVSTEYSQVSGNKIGFSGTSQHSGIVVNTAYNAGATDTLVSGNTSIQSGLLISVSSPNTIIKLNKKFTIFVSDTTSITYLTDNDIAEYRASGGGAYGLRVSGAGAVGVVTGGTNTATNAYNEFSSGVIYIQPPTTSYRSFFYGAAAPTSGTWKDGDIVWNNNPNAGGTIGWVCVTGGTPGTWKTFGTIAT